MEYGAEVLGNIWILAGTHQVTRRHDDAHIVGMSKEIRQQDLQDDTPA
jgi:hypothetical protein